MKTLKICSFNVKGINDKKKRTDIFNWLRRKSYDICLLQETHSTDESNSNWENEWGYKSFFSSYNASSRGTAILFKNTFEYIIHKQTIDKTGRYIILDITINKERLTLINVYGPNTDDPTFFKLIKTKIEDSGQNGIIIGGDFNVVQDYTLDTLNVKKRNNPKSHDQLEIIKDELDLYDPWRSFNPTTRMYTWHNTRNQHSRLDYFLISSQMIDSINLASIKPGYRSDHSLIEISLKLSEQAKGRGIWKFNNSLLKDETFTKRTRKCIQDTLNQYRDINQPNNEEKFIISDQMIFEMLKLEIRGQTIAYSSAKKKLQNIEEKKLDKKIDKLHETFSKNPNQENTLKLNEAQNELKILREKKVEGIIMRSKAKWHLEGERNSKYFCNLENQHYKEKNMDKLINDNNKELIEIKDILNEQKLFYKNLYTSKSPKLEEESEKIFFPRDENTNILSEVDSFDMEKDIEINECYKVLKSMKENKSPGSDGFTVEFYRFFWEELKSSMLKSFQESFKEGLLSDSQRLGVITCLPKPGKPKESIKNWRPISLLNIDYKIISGVIANRLKQKINPLISNCQKGFLTGRNIGECTRIVSDLIHKMKKKNMKGIFLLIDFEKAFDSLEWSFIDKTLSYFNFGENIRKWINIFYTNIKSCILNNGHCSERFELGRGVRQGDPLSPYLFILATEILASAIIRSKDIKGIKVDDTEYLISQLADDTTLFLENNENSFKRCIHILEQFSSISGLKMNYTKTLAIKIGLSEKLKYNLENEKNIVWQLEGKFKLLGIEYDLDVEDFTNLNYEKKFKEYVKVLNSWSCRNLTIYGRICVIKSLALPKLVHLFSALPDPAPDMFRRLNTESFKFIWGGKAEKIKRTTMYNDYENGGFKMPNFELFCMAQKLTWIKKLMDETFVSDWKTLFLSEMEITGGNYIWTLDSKNPSFRQLLNSFWNDVYKGWVILTDNEAKTSPPHKQPLYFNDEIKIDKKTFFNRDWFQKGIKYINDLLDTDGNIFQWNEFMTNYNLDNNGAFKYYGLIHAIPRNWKTRIKELKVKLHTVTHIKIKKLQGFKKPSQYFYTVGMEQLATRPINSETKWETICENSINWQGLYSLPFKITKDTKLRLLQLKIMHRILPTNDWLYKCKLVNTKNCFFCDIQTETIQHLFWECQKVKSLWLQLTDWLGNLNIEYLFMQKHTILGDVNSPLNIEHIKLITKEYIYMTKLLEKELNFQSLIQAIKYKICLEKQYLQNAFFQTKWGDAILLKLNLM